MQGQSGLRARLQSPFFQSVGLFIVAMLPRLAALGRYVTPDEPIWVYRSINFREALLTHDWAATIQSGHPGVTLTWLGAISVQLQLWLRPESREHLTWLGQLYWLSPDNGPAFQHLAAFLTVARLGPIIVTSLGIVAVYWLFRQMVGHPAAEFAALFLAADPFTAGLSGLFHLDGMLATFMLLAVLIILPRSKEQPAPITRREAVLSGLCTALAILTKTPGLFLLPFLFLIIVWRTLFHTLVGDSLSTRLRRLVSPLILWGVTILLVILVLLPAVWAAPVTVFETISGLATRLADSAVRPIFFLGQETLNPGPTFYPLVLAFRLSPVVVIGLLLSAVFTVERFGKSLLDFGSLKERFAKSLNNNIIWLLLFSLGFLFFLNLSAKRFDRYALPAILPLILISAVGLVTAITRAKNPEQSRLIRTAFLFVMLLYFNVYLRLPLTAYNWFAGGPLVAQKVFTTDWGEQTSAVAKDLADSAVQRFPEPADRTLYTSNIPAAAAFYPGPLLPLNVQTLTRLQSQDYVHFLPQDWQTADPAEQELTTFAAAKQYLIQQSNVTDLTKDRLFTGLEPADLMLPAFQSTPQQIHFAEQIAVRSAGALPAVWPNPILVGIEWERLQMAEGDYYLRLELVDQSGEVWLKDENPLLNAVDQLVQYWPINEPTEVFYTLFPP
ncbi:MAG: phospholipid carrier-dependent glycosyltransferase, partial [Candidatus Promineifilaceae bacterium]